MMIRVPRMKVGAKFKSPKRRKDKRQDKTMEMEAANVLRMLSVNLMVAATMSPPLA